MPIPSVSNSVSTGGLISALVAIISLMLLPSKHVAQVDPMTIDAKSEAKLDPDLLLTSGLLAATSLLYGADWIQRKILDRRLSKLLCCMRDEAMRVSGRELQQRQMDAALRLAEDATVECEMLLHLLMRRDLSASRLAYVKHHHNTVVPFSEFDELERYIT